MTTRTIRVKDLARVEGEGGLHVSIEGDQVTQVSFTIHEPPRFFEALLVGRRYDEAPDITARICGICPVAYQMSACAAMEYAFGAVIPAPIRDLRRLLYCGEWIESHVLHMFMLHAPDFLGYPGAVEMAQDHKALVQKVLRAKKAGNSLMTAVGGREIHPVNVRVGGFYKTPSRGQLQGLLGELRWGLEFLIEATKLTATFQFPDAEYPREHVALSLPDEYAVVDGKIISSGGIDIGVERFDEFFEESHEQRSNALHCAIRGRGAYMTGPVARFNLSHSLLSPLARTTASQCGLTPPVHNPFKSIIVRGVETIHAFETAIGLIEKYIEPERPFVDVTPRAGVGHGATEAPRGILRHKYALDENGFITHAVIVPPTAQNQKSIEADLLLYIQANLKMDDARLTHGLEQAIRNYDPCISCATHAINIMIDRK